MSGKSEGVVGSGFEVDRPNIVPNSQVVLISSFLCMHSVAGLEGSLVAERGLVLTSEGRRAASITQASTARFTKAKWWVV